jgi:hypothetical protein
LNAIVIIHPEEPVVGSYTGQQTNKSLRQNPKVTIAGIELLHRIRKNQFDLSKLQIQTNTASTMWDAVLAA